MGDAPRMLQPERMPSRAGIGPFARAALSSRFIGVAAMSLGSVAFYIGRKESARAGHDISMVYIAFSMLFLIPGILYMTLATFVARRRRWAVIASLVLAMFDMTLLGLLFVTSWVAPGAAVMCLLAGLFVVALAVMTTYLGRSLEALKRQ